MKRVHVFVAGRVQGVGFRWIAAQEAKRRGVAGFVRNLPDGRVEAVFEGTDEAVHGMVEWARRGPEWAEVTELEISEEPVTGEAGFETRN